jgi:hypothetical protein
MIVAGGFIPRPWKPKSIITSLRDVMKYSFYPGHKCPDYHRTPLWGKNNDHAIF